MRAGENQQWKGTMFEETGKNHAYEGLLRVKDDCGEYVCRMTVYKGDTMGGHVFILSCDKEGVLRCPLPPEVVATAAIRQFNQAAQGRAVCDRSIFIAHHTNGDSGSEEFILLRLCPCLRSPKDADTKFEGPVEFRTIEKSMATSLVAA